MRGGVLWFGAAALPQCLPVAAPAPMASPDRARGIFWRGRHVSETRRGRVCDGRCDGRDRAGGDCDGTWVPVGHKLVGWVSSGLPRRRHRFSRGGWGNARLSAMRSFPTQARPLQPHRIST
ncbi:hypothetical protein DAEQUDRAFT_731291 [Daedalea quercina L-15889]|uniref:Secreted protein n=1 Tax=Daedalea quercina L-15889 TaxID=1314783 RepID=A0A165MEZ5_9APHY|nr:hypothetical protein DAEQUDRAFT_731291 [Daedalea quercina L-15889]